MIRMVDLTAEMAGLWTELGAAPSHRGRLIMFVSAISGEGASTVAREFARLAAVRAEKRAWLVDADLGRQEQQVHMIQRPERFGRAGAVVAGSPDGSSFFSIKPSFVDDAGQRVRPARLLTAKPFLGRRLYTSRFQQEALKAGQNAIILRQGDYWAALAQHADTVIVDVPATDRSDAALMLAPFMDDVVLVVGEKADVGPALKLKSQIASVGGRLSGVVINRATYKPPKPLRRLIA